METSPLNTNATTAQQQTTNASATLADNFDNFLLLLTTQLQHQDPLEPLDPNEFTNQLVQFSSVEQLIAQNSRLDSLISLQNSSQVADAVSFMGKTVEAIGNTVGLVDGKAQVNYELTQSAESVNVVIRNSAGKIVRTMSGDNTVGKNTIQWDGRDDNGVEQQDGAYTFEINAIDEEENATLLNSSVIGVVDGVNNDDGKLVVTVNGVSYPIADIISVKKTESSETSA